MRRIFLTSLIVCLASTAHAQSAWFELPVPAASLALIDMGLEQGRTLVAQRTIRVLHSVPREGETPAQVVGFERLLTDLDRFETEYQRTGTRGLSLAMAQNSSERDVLKDVLDTLGIRLRERRGMYSVEASRDAADVALRTRLASAGIDAAAIEKRLNGGEVVTTAPAVIALPSPLSLEAWASAIFERPLPARSVFSAIIRDRQASLLFYGLQAMTPRTRAYLAGNRELLQRFYRDLAGPVAAFGSALHLDDDGHVIVPGGAEASDLWEAIADERLERVDRFARAIFERDGGRLAYFMDALAHLDSAHQRFALGLWIWDRGMRLERFRALYRTFVDVDPKWSALLRPFGKPPYDPATFINIVAVGAQGEPAAPASRRLWSRAFDGIDVPGAGSHGLGDVAEEGVVDAAWLVEHALNGLFPERRALIERLSFGQRAFGAATTAELEDVLVALRGFGRYPALLLTLERIGLRSPHVYALAVRHARQIEDSDDPTLAVPMLAQFQGALSLVARLARSGVVTSSRLDELVASLAALRINDGRYEGRVSAWLEAELLPSLPAAETTGNRPLETKLLHAMADRGETGKSFAWEGASYAVDLTDRSFRQLVAVRGKQGGNSVDDLLAVEREAAAIGQPGVTLDSLRGHIAALQSATGRLAPARPWPDSAGDVPDVKKIVNRAVQDLGKMKAPKDVAKTPRLMIPIIEVADYLLGETLTALSYAPWLGDPEELLGPQADVSHRHRFGFVLKSKSALTERLAWQPAAHDSIDGTGLGFMGSLFGLDLALAVKQLRRLATDAVPVAPRLSSNDALTIVQTLALLNPRDLTTEDMESIGRAITSGRERVRAAAKDASALDQLADVGHLGEVRRQLLSWTMEQEPDRVEALFSQAELLALGSGDHPPARADAWGTSSAPLTGCFCVHYPGVGAWDRLAGRPASGQLGTAVPDVTLRVAEHMAVLKVPASLVPAVLAMATQAHIDTAPPLYEDDWLGVVGHVQHLSREAVEDYVSAVVAAGPVRETSP